MRLSTSTNICAFQRGRERLPISFCIETCARAGYKVLDINFCIAMNPESQLRREDWEEYIHTIGQCARDNGITFVQSHLPYYDVFACEDSGKTELMEKLITRSIIASGMLGVRWAVTHPCTAYDAGQDMRVSLQRNLDYYGKHIAEARKYGVGIALENDFEYRSAPYQHIYCASVYELAELADGFHDPQYAACCYDFGHANLTGGFHRKNLNVLGKRLKAIHVQDNHGMGDEHLMPFFGNIDWEDAIAGLADIGYEGDLTYEIQEFGRCLPREMKHLVVEQSVAIGRYLIGLFEKYRA